MAAKKGKGLAQAVNALMHHRGFKEAYEKRQDAEPRLIEMYKEIDSKLSEEIIQYEMGKAVKEE